MTTSIRTPWGPKNGYSKAPREIFADPVFEEQDGSRLSRRCAYVWLTMAAAYTDELRVVNGVQVRLKRGQVPCGYQSLADAWGWKNKDEVRAYLRALSAKGFLRRVQRLSTTTVWQLLKYDPERPLDAEDSSHSGMHPDSHPDSLLPAGTQAAGSTPSSTPLTTQKKKAPTTYPQSSGFSLRQESKEQKQTACDAKSDDLRSGGGGTEDGQSHEPNAASCASGNQAALTRELPARSAAGFEYPAQFLAFLSAYPDRRTPKAPAATYDAFRALLLGSKPYRVDLPDGSSRTVSPSDLVDAARVYAERQDEAGMIGTQYVAMATSFLTPASEHLESCLLTVLAPEAETPGNTPSPMRARLAALMSYDSGAA